MLFRSERAAQRIVADLIAGGYLESEKVGRRNQYRVNGTLPLRHPIEEQSQVAALLALIPRRAMAAVCWCRSRIGS